MEFIKKEPLEIMDCTNPGDEDLLTSFNMNKTASDFLVNSPKLSHTQTSTSVVSASSVTDDEPAANQIVDIKNTQQQKQPNDSFIEQQNQSSNISPDQRIKTISLIPTKQQQRQPTEIITNKTTPNTLESASGGEPVFIVNYMDDDDDDDDDDDEHTTIEPNTYSELLDNGPQLSYETNANETREAFNAIIKQSPTPNDSTTIIPLLNQILQVQSNTASKVSKLERRMANCEVMLEKIWNAISASEVQHKKTIVNIAAMIVKDYFKLINSINDLTDFEDNLKNPQFTIKSHEQLAQVCNANDSRLLTEVDVCYTFVDAMFSRKFFTLVSWAGGSKTGVSKKPLRDFYRTLEFFTSLVRSIYPNFTQTSCQNFFKNKVIKNATERAKAQRKRVSRTKSRIKKKIKLRLDQSRAKNSETDESDAEDLAGIWK